MGDLKNMVTQLIKANQIVVFSKTTCPYCVQVKELLMSLGCQFTVHELDKMPDGMIIQDFLGSLTGARTVPRVFVNGKCIGGATETRQLHESGNLLPLLG